MIPHYPPFIYMQKQSELQHEQEVWKKLDEASKVELLIHASKELAYLQKNQPLTFTFTP